MDDGAHVMSLEPPALPLSRRSLLLKSSLTAGFCAAVEPVWAQVITTPSDGLTAGEVKVPSAGVDLPAYRAMPDKGGPFPTVLVIQEVFGVHEHIKDVCRRLAKLGYFAIAPELYARQGDPSKYTEVPKLVSELVNKVPDAQVTGDLDATLAYAKSTGKADTSRAAVIGFCWGGRQVWMYAAHNPSLKAGAAFYGPLVGQPNDMKPKNPTDIAGSLKVPVLGLYGGKDQGITAEHVQAMREALKSSSSKSEIIVYPDAPHGFNADYRPSYRKDDAQDAWAKATAWFKGHGAG
ncbi:MAG: dienelactone hydrolase family protein [Methylobacteriaceae bacterium]|nr:dienelactone hydrolase family protein [Methylobacteriaceae bacterium]